MPQNQSLVSSVFVEKLDHPEGVAVHPDGSVWCGGEAGQIYRIDPAGRQVEQVASTDGFVLGIAFSPDCKWLAICDSGRKAVLRMELADFSIRKFATRVGDWQMNIPNYPVFDRAGKLYVSESGEFRKSIGKIFCFDPSGASKFWAGGDLNFANGLALSAQEDFLYVVESFLPGISRFPILPSGEPGTKEVVVRGLQEVPDGLAFDAAGNLYCSCYAPSRVYRISPAFEVEIFTEDATCHLLSNCTNLAFGGTNFDEIFCSNLGRWHITRIQAGIKGMPLACHRQG